MGHRFDLTGLTEAVFAFSAQIDTELNYDAAAVQISTDRGVTWAYMTDFNIGAYNDTGENSCPGTTDDTVTTADCWTGGDGREPLQPDLIAAAAGATTARVRIAFISDGSHDPGISIDDVYIGSAHEDCRPPRRGRQRTR